MYDYLNNYYSRIPANTQAEVISSIVVGFGTVTIHSKGNLLKGAVGGILSGILAAVHAATTPLFKDLFEPKLQAYHTVICAAAAVVITAALGASLGYPFPVMINLFTVSLIETVAATLFTRSKSTYPKILHLS